MKVVLDCTVKKDELKELLLLQDGIKSVKINPCGYNDEYDIKFDDTINPKIIMKYMDMFIENKYYTTFKFDKETKGKFKTLEYVIDDICCEYCYMSFVHDAFLNDNIKSLDSDAKFNKIVFKVTFKIEYDSNVSKEDIIKYLDESWK